VARAVVLYFEDNNDADDFIAAKDIFITDERSNMHRTYPAVDLMVAVPTLFCHCTRGTKNQGWTRGLKWGWWVCSMCKKPSGHPSHMKRLRSCLGQARNLLEDRPQEVSEVTDEGWGVSGRG
jgi:hypothetical protein